MDTLPEEIICQIMEIWCNKRDALRLASCSKKYYELVKPLAWRSIEISHCISTLSTPNILENIKKYTSEFILYDKFMCEDRDSPNYQKPNNFIHMKCGIILSQILYSIDSTKLTHFHTDLTSENLEFILEIFPNIQELYLVFGLAEKVDPEKLLKLEKLESLAMEYPCLTMVSMEKILTGKRYKNLHLGPFLDPVGAAKREELFVNPSIKNTKLLIDLIGKQTDLTRLHLQVGFNNNYPILDITPLNALANLTNLELSYFNFDDKSLNSLWPCLTILRNLHFFNCKFSTRGVQKIDRLKNLESLIITENIDFKYSVGCMQYINLIPRLKYILIPDYLYKYYKRKKSLLR